MNKGGHHISCDFHKSGFLVDSSSCSIFTPFCLRSGSVVVILHGITLTPKTSTSVLYRTGKKLVLVLVQIDRVYALGNAGIELE